MDPNACLDDIRRNVASIESMLDEDLAPSLTTIQSLCESVRSLDEWITRGGFVPDAWDYKPPRIVKIRTGARMNDDNQGRY